MLAKAVLGLDGFRACRGQARVKCMYTLLPTYVHPRVGKALEGGKAKGARTAKGGKRGRRRERGGEDINVGREER